MKNTQGRQEREIARKKMLRKCIIQQNVRRLKKLHRAALIAQNKKAPESGPYFLGVRKSQK